MRQSPLQIRLSILTIFLVSLSCNLAQKEKTPNPPPGQSADNISSTQPQSHAASVTQKINKNLGGQIELVNSKGDHLTLVIPPFALLETTEITLTALSSPPPNPIANTFFSGVIIQPDQLKLRLPATLTLTQTEAPSSLAPLLFYLKEPGLVLPLAGQTRSETSISGKLLHFSTYTGGSPSPEEARTQASQAAENQGTSADGWQSGFEGTQALGEWSNAMQSLGMSDESQQAMQQASQQLKDQIECLFDLNCTLVPLDPCGEYQQQLMQYYEQATLLGFDPADPLMTQLYTELERVLNECTNRYTLEYDHSFTVDRDGLHQEIKVTGKVLFNAPMYGVFEMGEPLKFQGQGPVKVAISGTMTADDKICTISGSGQHDVVISGELEADETGEPWMALTVSETWYTQGSMTITCPDTGSQSIPLPSPGGQSYPLRLQYLEGAKSTAPNLGGVQGTYNWILHILHSW